MHLCIGTHWTIFQANAIMCIHGFLPKGSLYGRKFTVHPFFYLSVRTEFTGEDNPAFHPQEAII